MPYYQVPPKGAARVLFTADLENLNHLDRSTSVRKSLKLLLELILAVCALSLCTRFSARTIGYDNLSWPMSVVITILVIVLCVKIRESISRKQKKNAKKRLTIISGPSTAELQQLWHSGGFTDFTLSDNSRISARIDIFEPLREKGQIVIVVCGQIMAGRHVGKKFSVAFSDGISGTLAMRQ